MRLVAWPWNLYALAVWTPTRLFVIGILAYAIPALATTLSSSSGRGSGLFFTLVSTAVILLVRHVVRDRYQRGSVARGTTVRRSVPAFEEREAS